MTGMLKNPTHKPIIMEDLTYVDESLLFAGNVKVVIPKVANCATCERLYKTMRNREKCDWETQCRVNFTKPVQKVIEELIKGDDNLRQGTDKWLKTRETLSCSGSIAPALTGCGFPSQYEEFVTSRARARLNLAKIPTIKNDAMQWGIENEPRAFRRFVCETGHFGISSPPMIYHPDHPDIAASADGVTLCGATIEIKCPYRESSLARRKVVPSQYFAQCFLQMACMESSQHYFVTYSPQRTNGQDAKKAKLGPFCDILVIDKLSIFKHLRPVICGHIRRDVLTTITTIPARNAEDVQKIVSVWFDKMLLPCILSAKIGIEAAMSVIERNEKEKVKFLETFVGDVMDIIFK